MLMRPVWGIGAAALLLAFACRVPAQGIPDRATIKVQEAEVRSGHGTGPKFYATNKLRYGDVVEVTKTLDDGWLEIMPPRPQSFSWINARMLEQVGANVWMVKGERGQPVDVYYGSSVHEAKPDVRSTSVAAGSQVVSIAKAKTADDGMWLPIEPPPSERRYILAEALGRTNVAPRTSAQPGDAPVPPNDGPAKATSRVGAPTDGVPSAQAAGSIGALVADAQAAEKARDYGSAIKSWEDVAKASDKTNPGMAQNCRNHIQWLRDRINYIEAGNGPMPRAYERVAPRPNNNTVGAPNGSPSTAAPAFNGTSRSYSQGTAAEANRDGKGPTTKRVGQLQQAAWSPDNKPIYRLVSSDRQTYITVLPQQGVDLTPFVNRNVELEGTIEYHSEPRKTYLVTSAVNPLP
jgi:hypothetical protein